MFKLLLPFLFISFTAFAQTQPEVAWKTADEPTFFLQYPSDWKLDKSGQGGTSLILFSKIASDEDLFEENVNVIIEDLSTFNIDLSQYVSISESQIKSMIKSAIIVESSKMKYGTQEYHRLVYTGYAGDLRLRFEQYYFMKNKKAYVITFTAEQDTYPEYKVTGERILNSFKLK